MFWKTRRAIERPRIRMIDDLSLFKAFRNSKSTKWHRMDKKRLLIAAIGGSIASAVFYVSVYGFSTKFAFMTIISCIIGFFVVMHAFYA